MAEKKKRNYRKMGLIALAVLGLGYFLMEHVFVIKGSDAGKCIFISKTIQRLVYQYAQNNGLKEGDPLTLDDLAKGDPDAARIIQDAQCPSGGKYTVMDTFPGRTAVYYKCDQDGHDWKVLVIGE